MSQNFILHFKEEVRDYIYIKYKFRGYTDCLLVWITRKLQYSYNGLTRTKFRRSFQFNEKKIFYKNDLNAW